MENGGLDLEKSYSSKEKVREAPVLLPSSSAMGQCTHSETAERVHRADGGVYAAHSQSCPCKLLGFAQFSDETERALITLPAYKEHGNVHTLYLERCSTIWKALGTHRDLGCIIEQKWATCHWWNVLPGRICNCELKTAWCCGAISHFPDSRAVIQSLPLSWTRTSPVSTIARTLLLKTQAWVVYITEEGCLMRAVAAEGPVAAAAEAQRDSFGFYKWGKRVSLKRWMQNN